VNQASRTVWSAGYGNDINTAFRTYTGQKDFIFSSAPRTALVSAYPTQ